MTSLKVFCFMITAEIDARKIQSHYDKLSSLYRLLWGNHIHHGYWENYESTTRAPRAQVRLIEQLVDFAGIESGASVLDVGCGLGGSAMWLASNLGCSVVGLTISPVQAKMARKAVHQASLDARIQIEEQDANRLELDRIFDVLWVIECSEHLSDKESFMRFARSALRPGGVLAMCAWLAGEDLGSAERRQLVRDVCEGMLCPSLGERAEYESWMRRAGFSDIRFRDITRHVEKTWDLCRGITQRPTVQAILRSAEPQTRRFVASFESIRRAYAEDAMRYGMFSAQAG
jgi:tocopherol O-methyltransferase